MDNVTVNIISSYIQRYICVVLRRRLLLVLILFQLFSSVSLWMFWHLDFYRGVAINNVLANSSKSDVDVYRSDQTTRRNEESCIPIVNKNIDCRRIMMGEEGYLVSPIHETEHSRSRDCSLSQLLINCSRFIQAHGYDSFHVSQDEIEYPLAFAIKMHKDPEQVEQILRTIYRPHNVFCIYVDLKARSKVFNTMKNITRCFDNVYLIEDRENIVYASYSHVRSELACMKRCMQSNVRWKYYINMAGQEYPLRTNKEMIYILRKMAGSNDIESYNVRGVENRFKVKYVSQNGHLKKTTENKLPFRYHVEMRRGSAYGLFSREFVKFILEDEISAEIISWFNNTLSPEEFVWSTLNTLPFAPGGYQVETSHDANTFLSRAMIWSWDKVKCQGRFVRSVCNFGPRDLPWIASSPKFILNKINREKDKILVDCLEESYRNRTKNPQIQNLNWYYYLNLPHARYYSSLNKNDTDPSTLSRKKADWLLNNLNYSPEKKRKIIMIVNKTIPTNV